MNSNLATKIVINNIINFLNLIFPTGIFFLLFVLNENILATEVALTSSFVFFIIKSLTFNQRNLVLSKLNLKKIKNYFFFRLAFIPYLLGIILLFNILFLINKLLYFFFCLILLCNWVVEIVLVKNEIDKTEKANFIFFFIYIFFYSIIIVCLIYYLEYFNLCLIFFFLFLVLYIFFQINKKFFKSLKSNLNLINKKFFYLIKSKFFLSGFLNNLVNLLWKVIIIFLVGKNFASFFFFIFAIGSFPGTVFFSSFGAHMVKFKWSKIYLILFFLFYLLVLIISFFILYSNFNFSFIEKFFNIEKFIIIILFTSIGSVLMIYGLYERQLIIFNQPNYENKVYYFDIIISLIVLFIPVILYISGGNYLLCFSYFFVSLINYVFYKFLYYR